MSDNHESSDASQTDRGRTGRPSSALNMRAPAELTALKTRAELRSQTTIIDVWTVELPIKAANDILMYLYSSKHCHLTLMIIQFFEGIDPNTR